MENHVVIYWDASNKQTKRPFEMGFAFIYLIVRTISILLIFDMKINIFSESSEYIVVKQI